MLPDASAVTAAREKRRKFALGKIKKNDQRRTRRADKFVAGVRRAHPPCKLVKFALKFSLNLRFIKFGRALARFGRCGFVNLTAPGLRL